MALKDLVAQKSALAEEAIEKIVKDYVRYDPDERDIVFTPEFAALGNKAKILVYLVSIQGWAFVLDEPVVVDTKPAELEEKLGIPGGSLRPQLKDLRDRHLVVSKGAGYSVRASSLSAIERELGARLSTVVASPRRRKAVKRSKATLSLEEDDQALDGDLGDEENVVTSKDQKKRKSASGGDLKQTFNGWIADGFFNKPKTLADVQARFHEEAILIPRTSVPKYLLAGVRDKALSRTKEDIGGKQLWVYRTKSKG